ncbi:MAG: hypoxanthine phosphoribosyltransferase [Deltaproteobacteria bacterium]|jgi:hypoxanthine phosphoribosyltransferase|nr:hypoxanthine phosphoribosyltransferase [Deltaproteobacteria bacterium]
MAISSQLPALETVFSPQEIGVRVAEMGRAITLDYQDLLAPEEPLLVIGILNGAFIFLADLVRNLDLPVQIDFVRLSSYQNQTEASTHVVMLKNLEKEVKGRHVLVAEDIADYGLTLAWLLEHLRRKKPASLKLAVAVNKTARRRVEIPLDYIGFTVEDGFLVGYGLDYAEKYRQLPGIYVLKTPQ